MIFFLAESVVCRAELVQSKTRNIEKHFGQNAIFSPNMNLWLKNRFDSQHRNYKT